MKSNESTTFTAGLPATSRSRELRQVLEGRQRVIEASVRGQLSTVREERATADHIRALEDGEVSDVDIQEDIELTLVQMKLETLQRIDTALGRLDTGLYGRCIECGDDIPAARLRALPFAVRCLDCEDARETGAQRRPSSRAQPRRAGRHGSAVPMMIRG